jgi:hypothetical protein
MMMKWMRHAAHTEQKAKRLFGKSRYEKILLKGILNRKGNSGLDYSGYMLLTTRKCWECID